MKPLSKGALSRSDIASVTMDSPIYIMYPVRHAEITHLVPPPVTFLHSFRQHFYLLYVFTICFLAEHMVILFRSSLPRFRFLSIYLLPLQLDTRPVFHSISFLSLEKVLDTHLQTYTRDTPNSHITSATLLSGTSTDLHGIFFPIPPAIIV